MLRGKRNDGIEEGLGETRSKIDIGQYDNI
jgi:hypothetical protein